MIARLVELMVAAAIVDARRRRPSWTMSHRLGDAVRIAGLRSLRELHGGPSRCSLRRAKELEVSC